MTIRIEDYAASLGFDKIERFTLPKGTHVYRLDKSNEGVSGLPYFAVTDMTGWRRADPDETLRIMGMIYRDTEEE